MSEIWIYMKTIFITGGKMLRIFLIAIETIPKPLTVFEVVVSYVQLSILSRLGDSR